MTPFSEVMSSSSLSRQEFKLPLNMYAIALDDSKIQRKLLARYFSFAGIPEDRVKILGSSTREIIEFDDWAFSFIVGHPDDYFLFIVDENLDVHEDQITTTKEGTVSGSLCVSKIRRRLLPDQERRILALIRSANDSANDVAIYNSRTHGYLPKAPIKPGKVLEELAPLWLSRFPPLEGNMKRVSTGYCSLTLNESNDLAATGRDLIESVKSISSLVDDFQEATYTRKWPLIWDKLHILKGDLLTLSNEDNEKLSNTIELINSMRGGTTPSDFEKIWQSIRSQILSSI